MQNYKKSDPAKIGMAIRRERELAGLTQLELAKACNSCRASIGFYETGTRLPRLSVLADIARALKTTPESLCGVEGGEKHLRHLYKFGNPIPCQKDDEQEE